MMQMKVSLLMFKKVNRRLQTLVKVHIVLTFLRKLSYHINIETSKGAVFIVEVFIAWNLVGSVD